MTHDDKVQALAVTIRAQQYQRYTREYPGSPHALKETMVYVRPGKKYTKIDVGTSGKYMVDTDGNIYGIKAYGVIHRGHQYGTLDTIAAFDWSGYTAVRRF